MCAWGWVNGELVVWWEFPCRCRCPCSLQCQHLLVCFCCPHYPICWLPFAPAQPHPPPSLPPPLPSPPNPLLLLPLLHPYNSRNLPQRLLCCSRLHLQCYPIHPRPRHMDCNWFCFWRGGSCTCSGHLRSRRQQAVALQRQITDSLYNGRNHWREPTIE